MDSHAGVQKLYHLSHLSGIARKCYRRQPEDRPAGVSEAQTQAYAAMTDSSPSTTQPRWLVTGTSGRVGRMLRRHWQAEPPPCVLIVQSRRPGEGLEWDLLTGPLPDGAGPLDCLIAFAGVTPGPGADLSVNIALAEATLSAAHAAGIPRVLVTSSSAVYGAPAGDGPLDEDSPLRPVNAYGHAKLAMEAACAPWRDRGLEVCCLRIGNVAGADVLLLNGRTASPEAPLRIDRFADGAGPLRTYIGPETLAGVTVALARHPNPLPDVVNIGTPRPVAMANLATAAGMSWCWQEAPPTAIQRITLDLSRLESLYSFAPADSEPAEMIRQWHDTRDPA
ncbi:NAD(P)-dependent oxidoreductase [Rhodobacter sp. SGA-6-6]|uniref:NAD-dependent epimerase/dehydratase family protein n=1 Tax=Rhodobacter sp. SGA-6-6 TaxID=2710882 RepID=UPI0013E9FD21|nr:NAD(P)-dependent oxidoreductase [Rhodobacter sp. SGA-6-6]NGM44579.1 NAD(P)-dependent oxidoreductase [Rhodobacter sp. SGA-6-6]